MAILRARLLGTLCAVLASTQVGADAPAPIYQMEADGEVQIAPDGHVSDYRLTSELGTEVAGLVDKNVRGWRFEPVVIDGKPVVAKTSLHIVLMAEPAAQKDTYQVRIEKVRFGQLKKMSGSKSPRYPISAVHIHLGAKVLLSVHLDANGNVLDIAPYQTSLSQQASSEKQAEDWRREFEKSSIEAARTWHFNIAETFDGKAIGSSVLVPVVFTIQEGPTRQPQTAVWNGFVPGPIHPAPWMSDTHLASNADPSTLRNGEALPLDSHFHLKDDVIGKQL